MSAGACPSWSGAGGSQGRSHRASARGELGPRTWWRGCGCPPVRACGPALCGTDELRC